MQVSCIDSIEAFDKLKPAWDEVYSADPHATIFVSWAWLKGRLEVIKDNLLVLAVRTQKMADYVSFLPLVANPFTGNLKMLGCPFADYTGFVCLPEFQEEALANLAVFLMERLQWERFEMSNVYDARIDLFLNHFLHKKFNVRQLESTTCPYIPLPATWDEYLLKSLNQKRRKQLKRCLREIEGHNQFFTKFAQADNLEHYIEILLTLFQKQWGADNETTLNVYRALFRRSFQSNQLYLAILWSGETPVAASVAFVDRKKNAICDYIGGWDVRFASMSPGRTMIAYTIRYAIENGFKIYDLLRGDEHYKYSSFGAIDRFNANFSIERKSISLSVKKLKRRLRHSLRRRS